MKGFIIAALSLVITLNIYIICGVAAENSDTGIIINNTITPIEGKDKEVQMIYKIKTPRIIHYDFVLALDSSGSFSEKSTQKKAVLRDIPRFLSKIQTYYPDAYFNISIISWDDNIDFAFDKQKGYVKLNKKMPLAYKFAPLENITKNFNEFETLYKTRQTEITDYSVPIKASLEIFKTPENAPRDPLHTMRFIVLVTGNGEYTPCNSDLLNETHHEDIGIYTVGLDVGKETELNEYLKHISQNEIHPTSSASSWISDYSNVDTTDFETELNKTLESALKKHFDSIMNTSVAKNIEISDRLYGYYVPNIGSFRVDSIKGKSIARSLTAESEIHYYPPSEDNTSQVKIKVSELLPNSTTTVAFTLENTFDPMTLPVTVSERDGPLVICSPASHENPKLSYEWHINGQKKTLPLDIASLARVDERLNIMSAIEINQKETTKEENLDLFNMLKFSLFGWC